MVIFSYSATHFHFVTYFKDDVAHIFAIIYLIDLKDNMQRQYERIIEVCFSRIVWNLKNKTLL